MLHFRVEGPFEIKPLHAAGGKLIEKSAVETFWADDDKAHLADAVGCYVFGFRAGHGLVPHYVGKSTTGFKNECFQSHKLVHYNTALVKKKKGTPIMFFVVKDAGSTAAFEACIDRVEYLLIQFALNRNPDLENVQIADWAIQGVYRSLSGKPSESAPVFRRFLGIDFDDAYDADQDEPQTPLRKQEGVPDTSAVLVTEGVAAPQELTATSPIAGDMSGAKAESLTITVKGVVVRGRRTPDGFVVFADSEAVAEARPNTEEYRLAYRKKLLDDGILVRKGDHLVFTQDVEFSTPSAAAVVVAGGNMDGPLVWKDAKGRTLREILGA